MLSYRHAFHAGNFADVLKHSVLTLVLEYMTRKEKGISYIDSHAGAGMYQLTHDYAQKTGEYKDGIAKLINRGDIPEELEPYITLIQYLNESDELSLYPGSPGIAKQLLRRQDHAHLFELHPSDIEYLNNFCHRWRKSKIEQSDGYQGVLGLLPPPTRRGVVLIDPPFEIKEDYPKAVKTIISAYKKFATGTYILWYPVVKRELVGKMESDFINSNIRNLLQIEYCQHADTDQYGMTGTGLFVVNPPWQLAEQSKKMLTYLQQILGNDCSSFKVEQLIAE